MASSQEDHRNAAAWRVCAEILLILAVFFVAGGSPPPDVNEPHYLTRLKHYWQPDWCAGDLFLESPDAHFTIVLAAGWLARFFTLTVVAWIGRLLAWALLAWAWQRLSWRVAPTPWLAVLTAALWVAGMQQWQLAGEWVIGGVEAKCFAYVFVLLALREYVDRRWKRVWPRLGVACALHALVGAWAGVVLFTLWALYDRQDHRLSPMLPSLLLGAVVAMAGVLPPLLMNWGIDREVVQQGNLIYVFNRLPHHLALLSMRPDWLWDRASSHFLMLLVLAGLTWRVAWRRGHDPDALSPGDSDALVRLARFAWGAAVLMGFGFAIESLLMSQPTLAASLQKYYWYRLTDVAAPLAGALIAGALLAESIDRSSRHKLGLLLILLAACGWHLYGRLEAEGQRAVPPADRRMADLYDWIDVCQWANQNTPDDALFLVPKHAQSFKWRAERAEVVTYKDIPQNAAGLVEWRNRINTIYTLPNEEGEPRNIGSLSELGAEQLRWLATKYGAAYVLTDHYRPVSLPVAYRNQSYIVYDVAHAGSPTHRRPNGS